MNTVKNVFKNNKILIVSILILTNFRIFLAMKIPLFLQADALYDDFLFVEYTKEMLKFNWLGDFSYLTYAKGCSFSIFLVVNYILGIPYLMALILTYIFSIMIFIISIKKLINNKYFLSILYIFLLYSPVMFHVENVQKVYRGGLITSFALIVVSGIIGIYTRINVKNRKLIFWSILTSLSLSYFWFLKEDSIWILPFVICGLSIAMFNLIKLNISKKEKVQKIALVILPLIILIISNVTYKSINYLKYGEYSITDRNGTYFKEVIHDLLLIDSENRNSQYWITKDTLEKAYKASPSLKLIKDDINYKYKYWSDENGEIHGDIIYWVIKEAINDNGLYDKGGKYVNNYYKKIHTELQNGFKNGTLKKNNDIYISSVAKGITKKELNEYINLMKQSKNMIIKYNENTTGVYTSTGDMNKIALFNEFTMSQIVLPNTNKDIYKPFNYFINICKKIVSLYQKSGKIIYYLFLISFIILTIKIIYNLIKRKINVDDISIYLIVFGLFATCFVQFFGTTFFCRFLSLRKIYDYSSVMLPLLQSVELITIFVVINKFYLHFKKN